MAAPVSASGASSRGFLARHLGAGRRATVVAVALACVGAALSEVAQAAVGFDCAAADNVAARPGGSCLAPGANLLSTDDAASAPAAASLSLLQHARGRVASAAQVERASPRPGPTGPGIGPGAGPGKRPGPGPGVAGPGVAGPGAGAGTAVGGRESGSGGGGAGADGTWCGLPGQLDGFAPVYPSIAGGTFLLDLTDSLRDGRSLLATVSASAVSGAFGQDAVQVVRLGQPMEEGGAVVLELRLAPGGAGVDLFRPELRARTSDPEAEDEVRRGRGSGWITTFPLVACDAAAPGAVAGAAAGAAPEEGEAPSRRLVIDGQELIKRGFVVAPTLGQSMSYRLLDVRSFPRNLDVTVEYVMPDADAAVQVGFSFLLLPETPMKPRASDDRLLYFATEYIDVGERRPAFNELPSEAMDRQVSMIWRYDLSRQPDEQIRVHIDPSVPSRWREDVRKGIEAWNIAFSEIGFPKSTVRAVLPGDEDWPEDYDMSDARYSTISWSMALDEVSSMGTAHVDPRSGEILKSDIIMSEGWVRAWLADLDHLAPNFTLPTQSQVLLRGDADGADAGDGDGDVADDFSDGEGGSKDPLGLDLAGLGLLSERRRSAGAMLSRGALLRRRLRRRRSGRGRRAGGGGGGGGGVPRTRSSRSWAGHHHLGSSVAYRGDGRGTGSAGGHRRPSPLALLSGDPLIARTRRDLVSAGLRAVVMHETGHILGLRHNFKGSVGISWECTQDMECTGKNGLSTSVMDYLPMNFPDQPGRPVHFFTPTLGAYDKLAIAYGYLRLPEEPVAASDEGAPPRHRPAPQLTKLLEAAEAFETCYDDDQGQADPSCLPFDLTSDPIAHGARRLDALAEAQRRLLEASVAPGASYLAYGSEVISILDQATSAALDLLPWVGGVQLSYVHRPFDDDEGESAAGAASPPKSQGRVPRRPVPAPAQRRAIAVFLRATRPGREGLLPPPGSEGFLVWPEMSRRTLGHISEVDISGQVRDGVHMLIDAALDERRVLRVHSTHRQFPGSFNSSAHAEAGDDHSGRGGEVEAHDDGRPLSVREYLSEMVAGLLGNGLDTTSPSEWQIQSTLVRALKKLYLAKDLPDEVASNAFFQIDRLADAIGAEIESTDEAQGDSGAWAPCAGEGELCACSGLVRFGAEGAWSPALSVSDSAACGAERFGDPRPGLRKRCECLAAAPRDEDLRRAHLLGLEAELAEVLCADGDEFGFGGGREARSGAAALAVEGRRRSPCPRREPPPKSSSDMKAGSV